MIPCHELPGYPRFGVGWGTNSPGSCLSMALSRFPLVPDAVSRGPGVHGTPSAGMFPSILDDRLLVYDRKYYGYGSDTGLWLVGSQVTPETEGLGIKVL